MLARRLPSRPPQLWQPNCYISSRQFTSSTPLNAVRGSSSPAFDWRRPFREFPKPDVKILSTEEAANEHLETITSKRVTINADVGTKVDIRGFTTGSSFREGVTAIADGEGVMILHLARMKRAPEMLIQILNDGSIEKQNFGAPYYLKSIMHFEQSFFPNCLPLNLLDLRNLAVALHPRLEIVDQSGSNLELLQEYTKDALGMRIEANHSQSWNVQKIQRPAIDAVVNSTWITHIAGSLLRSRLSDKVTQRLEKTSTSSSNPVAAKNVATLSIEDRETVRDLLCERTIGTYRWDWMMMERMSRQK